MTKSPKMVVEIPTQAWMPFCHHVSDRDEYHRGIATTNEKMPIPSVDPNPKRRI
jgi:hypothetical protein